MRLHREECFEVDQKSDLIVHMKKYIKICFQIILIDSGKSHFKLISDFLIPKLHGEIAPVMVSRSRIFF